MQFAGKQAIGDAMSKEARPGPGAYPLPASFGPQQQSQKQAATQMCSAFTCYMHVHSVITK